MQQDRMLAEVGRLYLQNIELQDVIVAQAAQINALQKPEEQAGEIPPPPPEE